MGDEFCLIASKPPDFPRPTFFFCPTEADGAPRVLFLMGLPGAGKSTVPWLEVLELWVFAVAIISAKRVGFRSDWQYSETGDVTLKEGERSEGGSEWVAFHGWNWFYTIYDDEMIPFRDLLKKTWLFTLGMDRTWKASRPCFWGSGQVTAEGWWSWWVVEWCSLSH